MKDTIKKIKALLQTPSKVMITMHQQPDADALGSAMGLCLLLKKLDHEVMVVSPSDYPRFLNWMGTKEDIVNYQSSQEAEELAKSFTLNADIIFCLDFSQLHRIADLGEIVRASKAKKVLVDHHIDPEDFADFKIWSTKAAATAELIYEMIDVMGYRSMIDPAMANCLYAGIMTDTGSFKHSNTTKKVHLTVAELIDLGADNSEVSRLIYDNNSLSRLRLLGFALSHRLKVMKKLKVAYIVLDHNDLQKYYAKTGDTEGIVNYGLSIEGVVMAALITERADGIKFSFRSFGDFSVEELASKYFNGGGHKNASGGKLKCSLKEAISTFEFHVRSYRDQLNKEQNQQNEKALT